MSSPVAAPSLAQVTTTHERIPRPATVRGIRHEYLIAIIVVHLLALLACFPYFFSWLGFWLLIAGTIIYGQGINTCYHRLLTHRSFRVPRWFEHSFVILALGCMQDTPVKWVTTHRLHHLNSDEQGDPHSPLVSAFWGHCGWLMWRNPGTNNITTYQKYSWDMLKDPFYFRLEKGFLWLWIYFAHWVGAFLLGFIVGLIASGTAAAALQLGLSCMVWGAILRTVSVWHITWGVNSLCHLFGYRNYETPENSRNLLIMGYLSLGEGWHNNHHHDQSSASNQHRWWEIDMSYWFIKSLELVGIATRVVPPEPVRKARRQARLDSLSA